MSACRVAAGDKARSNKGCRPVKRIIVLPLLVLLFPNYVREPRLTTGPQLAGYFAAAKPPALRAVSGYIDIMQAGGKSADEQGVLIGTLDGGQALAALNAN